MKRRVVAIAALVGVIALSMGAGALHAQEPQSAQVSIGTENFTLEVARTAETQRTGLMHRTDLAECGGMVFLFAAPRPLAFWMHNTPTPLWLAFVDDTGRIVRLIERATPNDDTLLESYLPASAVIEINADCPRLRNIDQSAKVIITDEAHGS